MPEDKEQKPEKQEPKKKRGLPAVVLVAVGAMLGGAGAVFLLPREHAPDRAPADLAPKIESIPYLERKVELVFNPRTNQGFKQAKAVFQFIYRADVHHRTEIEAQIDERWDLMESRALLVLMRRTPQDILTDEGRQYLTADLIREMSLTLFPAKKAAVEDIIWKQLMVQ